MRDIIKVVRVITYTGRRDLIEEQLSKSMADGASRTAYANHVKIYANTIASFKVGGDTVEEERIRILQIVKDRLGLAAVYGDYLKDPTPARFVQDLYSAIEQEVLNVEGNATALPGGDTPDQPPPAQTPEH